MLKKNLQQALKSRKKDGSTPFDKLVFTFELVPARASRGKALDEIINFAEETAKDKKICALSITDNAGGHPALTPEALGTEIKALGIEPIIHFSCKDKNRNKIESELFELDRSDLNTLLVLTGDYPRYGYKGRAKPVFDLDSVLVLSMIKELKAGLIINEKAAAKVKLPPMDFYAGCVVSPFKRTQPEQIQQYLKLKRKIKAGAQFIITQMGYDIRKFHELRLLLDLLKIEIPLIGTVFIPNKRLANILFKGVIPGCTIPKRLLKEFEDAKDEKEFFLKKAAKLICLLCGLGFQGIHLSGPGLKYEDINYVIKLSGEYENSWQKYIDEFLFQEEWDSFIFKENKIKRLNLPKIDIRKKEKKAKISPSYLIGKAIHNLFFEPGKNLYNFSKKVAKFIEQKGLESKLSCIEYFFKEMLYECYRCGDCYLGDIEFLCPQSQCAKRLVNGPCGGSINGWCEVWPKEKRCLYVRAYERAALDATALFKDVEINPPRDWDLDRTSSWLNFFGQRDHHFIRKIGNED